MFFARLLFLYNVMMRQPTNNRNSIASTLIGSPLGHRFRCRYQNSGRAIASPATSLSSEERGLGGEVEPSLAKEGQGDSKKNKINIMSSQSNNNKRIAKNTLLLYFRIVFMLVVSLYTSRVIFNALGVEDFGIYNMVGGVVAMLSYMITLELFVTKIM